MQYNALFSRVPLTEVQVTSAVGYAQAEEAVGTGLRLHHPRPRQHTPDQRTHNKLKVVIVSKQSIAYENKSCRCMHDELYYDPVHATDQAFQVEYQAGTH